MQRMHPVFIMYWKWKMKTLQPGTVSRLQKKSIAAFHAALSCFAATSTPGSTSLGTYLDSKLHPAAFLISIPGFGFL